MYSEFYLEYKKKKKLIKGDLFCKNGHSVWKQPAYNGSNPPTHLFYNPNKS